MCDEKKLRLKDEVREHLHELEAAVGRYIIDGEMSAYRPVAVTLRALLTDRNSLNRWVCAEHRGNSSNVMEYLHTGNIHLRSMQVSHDVSELAMMPVFLTPHALFGHAVADSSMMPLTDWLDEIVGPGKTTRDMIREVGNDDMAHIAPRDKFRESWHIEKVESERRLNPWPQFILGAGIRLLYARYHNGRRYVRIYPGALRSVQRQVDADLKIRRKTEPNRKIQVGESTAHAFDPFSQSIQLCFANSEGKDISDFWAKSM